MKKTILLLIITIACATSVAAQVPVTPRPVPKCGAISLNINLDKLTTDYLAGDWLEISKQLDTATTVLQAGCIGSGEQWLIFVWPGKNALDDASLFSVVYPGVLPFSTVLPGLSSEDRAAPGLYEVFISPTPGAKLRSAYVITREDDPLIGQAAAALEKNFEKLISGAGVLVGFTGGDVRRADRAPTDRPIAAVASIGLPFERGKIVAKRRAVVPKPLDELLDDARKLEKDTTLREGRDSQAARTLADALVTKLQSALTGPACAGAKRSEDACRSDIAAQMSKEYLTRLIAAPPAEQAALTAVDKRFRDHVAAISGTKIDHEAALTNEPKTHFSIGTVVAYLGTVWTDETRVKVSSSGALVEDPLPRALTGVVVNWSAKGFQASDPGTPTSERFRAFTGVAVTPNIGWISGGTVQVVSGFSVNAGLALLALPTGEVGSTPESAKPFKTNWAWAPFVGAGFNWK